MLKVADDETLDEATEVNSAVMLGEELKLEKIEQKKKYIIFPLLVKPLNDPNKKWGENYYWRAKQRDNQTTFNSDRKGGRKHAGRDLYQFNYIMSFFL
ncbi:hypothetical protein ACFFU9_12325 [Mariniflexile ostreae]|uniref:Uncharacterized protein n=1 Tax=Mariniflexile ostreae TaxID=1520892 RepID=A0ABV5FDJ7_9FLAO